MQRLLWASTGTKDPDAPDVLYIEALVAPDTINTMPSETLTAFAGHGKIDKMMPEDGGDADKVLGQFEEKGIDIDALAADLQKQGAEAFEKSWNDLLAVIQSKCDDIAGDGKKAQRSKVQKAIH
jgi:transaldolase